MFYWNVPVLDIFSKNTNFLLGDKLNLIKKWIMADKGLIIIKISVRL